MIRITLIVDEEKGEEFIGVLAKGMGRGELGLASIFIERLEGPSKPSGSPPAPADDKLQGLIRRLPKTPARPPEAKRRHTPSRRRPHFGEVGIPEVLYKALQAGPLTHAQMIRTIEAAGYSPNSIGSGLVRMRADHPDVYLDETDRMWKVRRP